MTNSTQDTAPAALDAAQVASLDAYKAKNAKHGWTGRGFSFSPGFLNLNSDGGASIGCMDTEAECESDDETGKMAVFFNMPPEEVLALRDYLNAAFPTALQQQLDEANELKWGYYAEAAEGWGKFRAAEKQLDEARAERDMFEGALMDIRGVRSKAGASGFPVDFHGREMEWVEERIDLATNGEPALSARDAPQAIDPIISWMVTHGWLDADAEYSTADLIRALDDNYTEVGDAPQAQAVKALGDACQLFEGFDDAAKIMITAKSSKGGSVKLDGPALTVGALRALTRPSTTEAKPVDPKLIENVAYICGQWEKNQGASSLTIAVRLLLAALDNDKEQSE